EVADPVLLDGERVGHTAERRDHFERQRFMAPDRRVVAEQYALGRERRADSRDDVVPGLLEPGREQLGDDVRSVAVHDQRRQPIAFGVDHAVRRSGNAGPPGQRRGDPLAPPAGVDRLAPARQQPQPDLRLGRIQRLAEVPATAVGDRDDAWCIPRLVVQVGPIDPGVTPLPAARAGYSAVRSGEDVKIALSTSSGWNPFASWSARNSSAVASRIASRVLAAAVVAPRSPRRILLMALADQLRLMVITDAALLKGRSVVDACRRAVAGGGGGDHGAGQDEGRAAARPPPARPGGSRRWHGSRRPGSP